MRHERHEVGERLLYSNVEKLAGRVVLRGEAVHTERRKGRRPGVHSGFGARDSASPAAVVRRHVLVLVGKEDRLFTLMSEVLGVPKSAISLESTMGTVDGWDSLKHMALIFALEESFEVTFTDSEVVDSRDVRSLLRIVEK